MLYASSGTYIVAVELNTFSPKIAEDGSWTFFAFRFNISAINILFTPETLGVFDVRDVRLLYNPIDPGEEQKNSQILSQEKMLIYRDGIESTFLPIKECSFVISGVNYSDYYEIHFEDVLRYKINKAKNMNNIII